MKECTPIFSPEFLRIAKRLKKDLKIELEKAIEKVLEDPKKGKPLSYRFKGYWSFRIGK